MYVFLDEIVVPDYTEYALRNISRVTSPFFLVKHVLGIRIPELFRVNLGWSYRRFLREFKADLIGDRNLFLANLGLATNGVLDYYDILELKYRNGRLVVGKWEKKVKPPLTITGFINYKSTRIIEITDDTGKQHYFLADPGKGERSLKDKVEVEELIREYREAILRFIESLRKTMKPPFIIVPELYSYKIYTITLKTDTFAYYHASKHTYVRIDKKPPISRSIFVGKDYWNYLYSINVKVGGQYLEKLVYFYIYRKNSLGLNKPL